jgi:hypothetical protein
MLQLRRQEQVGNSTKQSEPCMMYIPVGRAEMADLEYILDQYLPETEHDIQPGGDLVLMYCGSFIPV